MGSSTKKHKKDKDVKKKKHKSRSRSPPNEINGRDKEKRHHHHKKKDRKRERERSPDVEEVPIDSHLERSPKIQKVQGSGDSLSIEETNKLRVKLGLKPLEVSEKPADDGKFKDDLGEFYHKPAANLAQIEKMEKIKQKLQERREKRQLEKKLNLGGGIGDASDDDDLDAWVEKSRKLEKQKLEAEKKAKELEELDEQFGISAIVEEEALAERRAAYTQDHLRGLRVAHDTDYLADEREVILTLADKKILDDDDEDVLVNVNLLDDDRYRKNIELKKQAKSGYQPYDDEGSSTSKSVLSKYDDEIDSMKKQKESGFVIGDMDALEAKKFKEQVIRERLYGGKRLENLELPSLKIASDYYNEEEMEAKFKKPKKKGKMRKKPKVEAIDVDDMDLSGSILDTDDTDIKDELLKGEIKVEEEEVEVDSELQEALQRARRLHQEKEFRLPALQDVLSKVKEEEIVDDSRGGLTLDATAEFCRSLGDTQSYEAKHANAHQYDPDEDMQTEDILEKRGGAASAWARVDIDEDDDDKAEAGGSGKNATGGPAILDEEPELGGGLAGALKVALSKGYLEKEDGPAPARMSAKALQLMARNYSIDDKAVEDDKYSRRERGHDRYCGPIQDFREKEGFKPDVKLDYIDDDGRPLCPKEAFRYLSHKFHGKGPGKNKQEKRIKKNLKEGLMKQMSSTDTPLGTLAMLQEKQKEMQMPYIPLSKSKKEPF